MGLGSLRIAAYIPPMDSSAPRSAAWIGVAIAALLVVAGCSGGGAVDTSFAPLTSLRTTTAAPEATSTSTAPTTTSPPLSSTTAASTTTIDTNLLASGSGCTPGSNELPDGEWFGFIVDASADVIEFDLACWFTGDAAIAASAEDGEESPPPNDYYIRNANPATRAVQVASDAAVTWLPDVGDPASETDAGYSEWLTGREDRGVELQPGIWITVTDGALTMLREQYVP